MDLPPNGKHCQRCRKPLVGKQRIACSGACRASISGKRRRAEENALKPHPSQGTRGRIYHYLKANPLVVAELVAGRKTVTELAAEFNTHKSTAARNFNQVLIDEEIAVGDWQMENEIASMLGLDEYEPPDNPDDLDVWLDRQVDGFVAFRTRFFKVKAKTPYYTEPFHRNWIKQILRAIVTGTKLLILSPPRHGKSELLGHFCVWLICRDYDIRIIWVGGNADIAADMVSSIRDHLEENADLIAAVLPPGETFKPEGKQGVTLQNTKFRIKQRASGLKGNTIVAVGRTGKILSRDADFIVSDDIEDHESTAQPAARASTRKWFMTTLSSRKEEHTGWVAIGSRQHPDDLYGYLLEDNEWANIVDAAHQETCPHPPHQFDLHIDCMLFPQLRTYKWLMQQRRSAAALGLETNWEMVYLNVARSEGMVIFVRTEMEACFNWDRDLGTGGIPDDSKLVGGLDPAATGYQCGWAWAWSPTTKKLYMVDVDNRLGGGIDAWITLGDLWRRQHQIGHWVIEDKGFQSGYREEQRVKDWANDHNIFLEGHTTGTNKADPNFGVGAMAKLYQTQMIDLPYGSAEAREKVMAYTRQALRFVDTPINRQIATGRRNRSASDMLMASWFPMKVIRRWQKETEAGMTVQYDPAFAGWDITQIDQTPW